MDAGRIFILALAVVLSAGTANGGPAFRAGYDIHVGGFRVGEMQLGVSVGREEYSARLSLEGRGVLSWFAELRSEAEASGEVDDDRLLPRHYRAYGRWNRQERRTHVVFNRDGLVEQLEIVPEPDHEPVPKELRRAPDPVSALIEVIRSFAGNGETEERHLTSFGGIRAGRLRITCPTHETVHLAEGIDLPRRALRCEMESEQIAGPPPRHVTGLGIEDFVRLWMVRHEGGAVPIRAESLASFGAMVIRLTSYQAIPPGSVP